MTEAEWLTCADPGVMLDDDRTRPCARKRRLFAVACCRRIVNLMTAAGKRAVDAAEAFADGECSERKLHAARLAVHFAHKKSNSATTAARSASYSGDLTNHCASCAAGAGVKSADIEHHQTAEQATQADLLRDIFGNPFHPVAFDPAWRTDTAVAIARQMYESRDFGSMPILADALQDAGCDNAEVLNHSRDPHAPHVRGCWVVDLVLGL